MRRHSGCRAGVRPPRGAIPCRQALLRFTIAKGHADCIAELHKPVQCFALRRDSQAGRLVPTLIDRREGMVERIWEVSEAATGLAAYLEQPIETWFGKKNLF